MKPKKRITKQLKVILEVLQNTSCHPTADWIYEEARKIIPGISLGTVYRNLQYLVNEKEIQELRFEDAVSRFDSIADCHYHFVCQTCGAVIDVNIPVQDHLNDMALESISGIISYHRLEYYGICKECLKKC